MDSATDERSARSLTHGHEARSGRPSAEECPVNPVAGAEPLAGAPRLAGRLAGALPAVRPLRVDVILPVRNEVDVIDAVIDVVLAGALAEPGHRFIFVDDGSTDGTGERLRARLVGRESDGVELVSHSPSRGKGGAVAAGVAACDGDLVVFMDGDLAYSLDHLPEMVEALGRHDVVIGSRNLAGSRNEGVPAARRVLGWGFNRLARVLLDLPYRDTQAGLKGFRRAAARRIFAEQRVTDFTFDVEVLCLARRFGCSVGEIAARVSPEHSYAVTSVDLVRDPLRMLWRLVLLRARGFGKPHGRALGEVRGRGVRDRTP